MLKIQEFDNDRLVAEVPPFPLVDGTLTIGRSTTCSFRIGKKFPSDMQTLISRVQATVTIKDGVVTIKDGDGSPSQHGIYRGYHRLVEPIELRTGERISLFRIPPYRVDIFLFDPISMDQHRKDEKETMGPQDLLEEILRKTSVIQMQQEQNEKELNEKIAHLEQNQAEILEANAALQAEMVSFKTSLASHSDVNTAQSKHLKYLRLVLTSNSVVIIILCLVNFTNPSNKDKWENTAFILVSAIAAGAAGISGQIAKGESK